MKPRLKIQRDRPLRDNYTAPGSYWTVIFGGDVWWCFDWREACAIAKSLFP